MDFGGAPLRNLTREMIMSVNVSCTGFFIRTSVIDQSVAGQSALQKVLLIQTDAVLDSEAPNFVKEDADAVYEFAAEKLKKYQNVIDAVSVKQVS